jgi:UDP-3-O-[3-hydroxymyristoyl] glucosamine N-acyltransferase
MNATIETETAAAPATSPARKDSRSMDKPLLQRILNRVLSKLARSLPGSTSVRPTLHRWRGVRIKGTVFIGDDVYLENEYPECVTMEDGAQIGLRTVVIAHTREIGRVVIGKDVFIGASCVIIAPGGGTLTIGDGAVVSAGTVILSDVPPATLMAPERAKAYARVTVPFTMHTDYEAFRRGLRPLNAGARKTAHTGSRTSD